MRQFVLPSGYSGEGSVRIEGADSKYILKVLRLGPGDSFPAVDHRGLRYSLEITASGSDYFTANCSPVTVSTGNLAGTQNHKTRLILLQCLPKGKKLEIIIRQAVEAGVDLIIPVESEHSVALIKEERASRKTDRLRKIAEEAAQQSGNAGVPEILPAVKMPLLPKVLKNEEADGLKLFFHQERLAKESLHRYLNSDLDTVCILIGPEGGLSNEETDFLLATGFHPVYLGENVLRTETAAIYALGAVKTILLEKDEWKTDIRE
ncbi:MAG: RsmE family RNA methyltransferase [Spirochaetales bacterium]|uniref:Ribosomal RNA small subunit methyltransferase E n=1 Tax=Candidatus Thalassospirochaeta sargassi TaxID=3119039 RepID=A0AAJ1IF15_9SPIO|nr:RsmE family RNA methyltransferase [Spirochaetales bacterium]